jgi:hypothetical protein
MAYTRLVVCPRGDFSSHLGIREFSFFICLRRVALDCALADVFSFLLLLSTFRDLSHTQTRSLSNFHSIEILSNALCNCCAINKRDLLSSHREVQLLRMLQLSDLTRQQALQRPYAASHDIMVDPCLCNIDSSNSNVAGTNSRQPPN